ncbi:hypothetical protein BDN71DRAFT_1442910 [Pleurotus eryngii]|uniref:Uncharacterized protein n=1 Tax=Pleurotus eryngii TaxID=5323 RepID=A0A9P6DIH0_PLEER|nr:hypothetical protein BDN71DRAFT_1442910 [Pleurotus eryngii]
MPESYSFRDNQTVKLVLLTPTHFWCRLSCQCVTVTYSFRCRLSKRIRPYLLFGSLQTEVLVSYLFRIQLNFKH